MLRTLSGEKVEAPEVADNAPKVADKAPAVADKAPAVAEGDKKE